MKSNLTMAPLALVLVCVPAFAGSATSDEAALWNCFDRMELAESFDNQSTELYDYSNFPFTFEGKEYNIRKLENDLFATPYRFGSPEAVQTAALAKLTDEQKLWIKVINAARVAAATRPPVSSKRATYTFAEGRLNGALVPGWPVSTPERLAQGSTIRPYAYVFSRGELSGRYLYVLTEQGTHKIPVRGSGPYFIPFAATSETSAAGMIVSLRGDKVNVEYHSYGGYAEGYRTWTDALQKSGNSFVKMAREKSATPIDLPTYRSYDSGTLTLVREELANIAKAQAASFSSQLGEVQKFTPVQKDLVSRRFGSATGFARNLKDQYAKAITACSSPVPDATLATSQMDQAFETAFPATLVAKTVNAPAAAAASSTATPVASQGL